MAKRKKNELSAFILEGALTINEVTDVHKKYIQAFKGSDPISFDLNKVTDCDTAGVQLLYCLLKGANKSNKKVSCSGFPQAIQYAADRIGLEWDRKVD